MTRSQKRGYENRQNLLITREFPSLADPAQAECPVLVEIGFGMGTALRAFASEHSDWTCIGVDLYRPGIGAVVEGCIADSLENVFLAETDAMSFLGAISPQTIKRVLVFFPDPWPKRRHWKRRLINADFGDAVAACLKPEGELFLATDWNDYAHVMADVMGRVPCLEGGPCLRPAFRPLTAYEAKGLKRGDAIWDFCYRKLG